MKKIVISFLLILLCVSLYSENSLENYIVDRKVGPDGSEIIGIKVPGGRPPEGYVRKEIVDIETLRTTRNVVIIDDVPAFDWSYGCSATSAAIIAGYYDRNGYPNIYTGPTNGGIIPLDNSIWNESSSGGEGGDGECPLSATHQGFDGLTSRGHVDNYWIESGSTEVDPYITNGWTPHANADCTGDFMGTNQSAWSSTDGSTTFYTTNDGSALHSFSQCEGYNPPRKDGGYGFEQFMESRGYSVTASYNQKISGYEGNTQGFTFAQYMAEIDANRPVLIHVTGHTMVGFGYDSSDQTIYIKNTWDYSTHTMTWAGEYSGMTHYSVTVLNLDSNQSVLNGDTFSNPLTINSLPFSTEGNTNDYTHTVGYSSPDVIYQIYLSTPAYNVTISTNGSSFDTYLGVFNSEENQTHTDNNSGEGNNAELTGVNFNANTIYYVCVEGNYSSSGIYSLNLFVEGLEYLTLECNDSFGDGWSNTQYGSGYQANSINVQVNGLVVIQNFTFDNGTQATTTFGVLPGNTVTTTFNAGEWPYECSYRILDSEGVELGAGDDETDISFVYGNVAVQTPKAVENLEIIYLDDTIVLAWDNVEMDVDNNPLTPDRYIIYNSGTNGDDYIELGTSEENFFSIAADAINFNPAFIKVTAVKDD